MSTLEDDLRRVMTDMADVDTVPDGLAARLAEVPRRERARRSATIVVSATLVVAVLAVVGVVARMPGRQADTTSIGPAAAPTEPGPTDVGGLRLLGRVVADGGTMTLPATYSGRKVTGQRVYWFSVCPVGKNTCLNQGVTDATGTTYPDVGEQFPDDLTDPGIVTYQEVDNGDAVAIVAGTGAATSSLATTPRSHDLGYLGLRLVVFPGNDGRRSTATYTPGPGETVTPGRTVVTLSFGKPSPKDTSSPSEPTPPPVATLDGHTIAYLPSKPYALTLGNGQCSNGADQPHSICWGPTVVGKSHTFPVNGKAGQPMNEVLTLYLETSSSHPLPDPLPSATSYVDPVGPATQTTTVNHISVNGHPGYVMDTQQGGTTGPYHLSETLWQLDDNTVAEVRGGGLSPEELERFADGVH